MRRGGGMGVGGEREVGCERGLGKGLRRGGDWGGGGEGKVGGRVN